MAQKNLKIRCLFDQIITTCDTRKTTDSGIILKSNEQGEILTKQTVLVAGPNACVKAGEEIELNTERFPVKTMTPKHGIGPDNTVVVPPTIVIDKEVYLYISSREI